MVQRLFNELTRAHTLSYRLTGGLVGQHHVGTQREIPLVVLEPQL